MDITVAVLSPTTWSLVDLLGRRIGVVEEEPAGEFRIRTEDRAAKPLQAMKHGPFSSLDAALSEIETFTRGSCRRAPLLNPNGHS